MKLKSLVLLVGSLLLAIPAFAEAGGSIVAKDQITKSAAGGTVTSADGAYAITISEESTTVAALAGTVTFTTPSGEVVKIDIGSGLVIGADGEKSTQSLKSLIAADTSGALAASLKQVLTTVSNNAARGDYGNGATSVLAALTKVLVTANPSAAGDYVGIAVNGVTASGSGVGDKVSAVNAITEATREGVFSKNDTGGLDVNGNIMEEIKSAADAAAKNNNVAIGNPAAGLWAAADQVLGTSKYSTTITPIDPSVVTVSPSGGNGTTR